MKTVLVTGASGMLGGNVLKSLGDKDVHIIASIMQSEQGVYVPQNGEDVILNDDIFSGNIPPIDVVINCAFARSNNAKQLADALAFTTNLIKGFNKSRVRGVINISSQGVYKRLEAGQLSKEDSPIEPIDLYSMSKYAAEKMFDLSGIPHVTNIRLASLNMKQRFLYSFVKNAKEDGKIYLNSPRVYASILDVEDAAEALVMLAMTPSTSWKPVYNLSIGSQYSLAEYAKSVQTVGNELGYQVEIVISDNGNESSAGTDISLIKADTGWSPKITNEKMIEKLFYDCI